MNKTTKTFSLIVFAFFISQNLYSQLFINKIDNKDIEIVEKAIQATAALVHTQPYLHNFLHLTLSHKEALPIGFVQF